MKLTKKEARSFLIENQMLFADGTLSGKEGILKYIRHVNCIQFDPLDMVGRNPHLVLQSRIDGFRPEDLDELLYSDRKLLDGWDKNMSIYPIEDWPRFERYRADALIKNGSKSGIDEILPEVRDEIERRGPLSSIDLEFDMKVDWPWAPTRAARAALESMHFWGELVIHHRTGTRKFYDFARKHVDLGILETKDPNATMKEYFEWNVKRRIGAIGLLWNRSGDAWLGIRWMKAKERNEAVARLEERGEILRIEVENVDYPFYVRREDSELIEEVRSGGSDYGKAAFIAPLDNLIWDRKMTSELFGFEYIWEVYKPVSERRYGYYVLPVLHGDRFVARFEPKFDKKARKLLIKNWWWEKDVEVSSDMKAALKGAFGKFKVYLGANDVEFDEKNPSLKEMEWLL